MKTRFALAGSAVAALSLLGACGWKDTVWMDSHNFPSNTWRGTKVVTFSPDSVSLAEGDGQKLLLTLRYAASAPVATFPIVVETEWPQEGIFRADTLTQRLLPGIERTGNNSKNGTFEVTDTITLPAAATPGWSVSLRPADASAEVNGIYSITASLIK